MGGYYLSSFGQWHQEQKCIQGREREGTWMVYCIVNGLWNCSHFADRMSAGSFIKFWQFYVHFYCVEANYCYCHVSCSCSPVRSSCLATYLYTDKVTCTFHSGGYFCNNLLIQKLLNQTSSSLRPTLRSFTIIIIISFVFFHFFFFDDCEMMIKWLYYLWLGTY